jgi:hypothetical protein
MLPPQSQLTYNPKDGVGKIRLIFSSRYASIGGYGIKVGRPAFDRCIIGLSKAAELHDNTDGQRALKAGPLSLPMVGISEAIRFDPWRTAVKDQVGEEVDKTVDDEYGDYFQFWQSISYGIASKMQTSISGKNLEVEDMVKLVRILKRTDAIKATKAKWRGPSSSR